MVGVGRSAHPALFLARAEPKPLRLVAAVPATPFYRVARRHKTRVGNNRRKTGDAVSRVKQTPSATPDALNDILIVSQNLENQSANFDGAVLNAIALSLCRFAPTRQPETQHG